MADQPHNDLSANINASIPIDGSMPTDFSIPIGMNGRFFPANWRPALDEIAFAGPNGFRAMQFPGIERGLDEEHLDAPIEIVAEALANANVVAVMEIVVRSGLDGKTALGNRPLDLFYANLPAMKALPCLCAHWHIMPAEPIDAAGARRLEELVVPQLKEAAEVAAQHNIKFGIEHNEPQLHIFATPDSCGTALSAVPGLHLVWDLNHVIPEHFDGFASLIPRMSMLHVSDTPLPTVNAHYPLGMGCLDFVAYSQALLDRQFSGPAILEIGGTPYSGGFGRDTDEALIDSMSRFRQAVVDAGR